MHHGDALPIVDHKTPMQDALITMTSKGFGIAVVIQEMIKLIILNRRIF
jgi:arabinose-5-phosphate isomerase